MIKTPKGDYYTPKEVLRILLNAQGYPKGDYQLCQPLYGGFFIREESNDVHSEKA